MDDLPYHGAFVGQGGDNARDQHELINRLEPLESLSSLLGSVDECQRLALLGTCQDAQFNKHQRRGEDPVDIASASSYSL